MKKFNFESKTAWWIVEPGVNIVIYNGNVMHQCDNGKRDSIGRTFEAYYTYKDKRFLDAIMSCWSFDGKYWRGKRYPKPYETEVPMSRDHLFNTIYALHLGVKLGHVTEEDYKHFISHQPLKLSNFARQSTSMFLWLQELNGKWLGKFYYPYQEFEMRMNLLWNKFLYKITGVGSMGYEEHQDDFKPILIFPRAKILDALACVIYPNYTIMSIGHRIQLLDPEKVKRIKSVAQKFVPKYNYLGKLLFDHPDGVSREEIKNYKPMYGDRWSDILNPWINWGRNVYPIEENLLKENVLDKDFLITLWEDKTQQKF